MEEITSNKQYQSWIYDILVQQDKMFNEDFDVIKDCIQDFEKLCKRPDLTPQQRNIQNYKHFQDLQKFVLSFQNLHKLNTSIFDCFEKLYENDEYVMYLIKSDQYEDCNRLFGGVDDNYFNTGWCVAKNEQYFVEYLAEEPDDYNGYIVWIEKRSNKPFALLHYGSYQFKDTSDYLVEPYTDNIIDGLLNLNDNLSAYTHGDFQHFKTILGKYKTIKTGKSIGYVIAELNGYKFDESTNTLDCCGKRFFMKNEYLNDQGTFDFKLTNTSNDWDDMFNNCYELKSLPDHFIIPDHVDRCMWMFNLCTELTHLPENFTIPSNVQKCNGMFHCCEKLKSLPENFTIPDNIKNIVSMFANCSSLTTLPLKFKLPEMLVNCQSTFNQCVSLSKLPEQFTIPQKTFNCEYMFYNCSNLSYIPKTFNVPEECSSFRMFYGCDKLTTNIPKRWK